MNGQDVEYVGFWLRVVACLIDTVLLLIIVYPLLIAIYGWEYLDVEKSGIIAGGADFLIQWLAPAVAVVLFWLYRQATPGKMAVSAKVVDEKTGGPLSTGQAIGRYLAYFVSILPLLLGFLWIAFDRRKQGWHDKLAGTLVIRSRPRAQTTGTSR